MRILGGLFLMLAAAGSNAAEITPVDRVERYVNIRGGPDAGAAVVGQLRRGETLPSGERVDGWFRVEMPDGSAGYVHEDWAVVVAPDDADAGAAADVNDGADGEVTAAVAQTAATGSAGDDAAPHAAADEVPVPDEKQPDSELVDEVAEPVVAPTPASEAAPSISPLKGRRDFVVRFKTETTGTSSQIYDDGNVVGIGTTAPQQRLEVNGSIQINDQNSGVAGLMITQSSGDTGYILHNRASTLTIGAGSVDRITIDRAGNVGIAVARPEHPLHMANGAYLSAGGVWTNSSSREAKEAISRLDAESAAAAVMALEPVRFRYRADGEETHLGFIAEDVPELVASADRSGLSAMDIVAALTRVVQAQEQRIAALEKALARTRE